MKVKTINEYINENKHQVEGNKTADAIKNVFHKHFPNSYIVMRPTPLGGNELSVAIAFEKPTVTMHGDPIHARFFVGWDGIGIERILGGGFKAKPTKPHHGSSTFKVPFRKSTKGDAVKKFEEYLIKLKKAIKNNMDQIRDEDLELYKSKIK